MRRARRPSTRRTVLVAGGANVLALGVKLAAGLLVGSSVLLAEAAHSLADTLNQAFLLASLRQSEKPADRVHPFGYGQERYFWSLLAAFGIFVAGAFFSMFEGILALRRNGGDHDILIGYVALAVCGVAEIVSLTRAGWQVRRQARERRTSLAEHVRTSPDTTVKAALFEDSAAVIGLLLAFAGLLLRQLTGSQVWDGVAAMAVGVLLIAVAIRLGAENRDLLIGKAADPQQIELIRSHIEAADGVAALLQLQTMRLGPANLIVAARVAFDDDISADRAEDIADAIDRSLADRLDVGLHVFLDPTQLTGPERQHD